jgi:Zc3h12a-like Ribonuclease NYN domain
VKKPTPRVVVDGSNLATEGRTTPSLSQLDDVVRAFLDERPGTDVIVVVDASFEHRVAPAERARFKEAEIAGEIVTPPAGALGRGDAFILKIAQRIDAVVLSNDSFQEFHDEYPWLFDVGRLIGGKPVKGVGWIFTDRLPVRGPKSVRATKAATKSVKKLAVTMPGGVAPAIGDTLTPVKATKATKATKTTKAPAKKTVKEAEKATASKVAARATKAVKKATKAAAEVPVVAVRRSRQPVNPEDAFAAFVKATKIGARIEGEVKAFTSHGAVITATVKGVVIECYAPTTNLGTPPPARARDVLQRGDVRTFKLVTGDGERRIAELGL